VARTKFPRSLLVESMKEVLIVKLFVGLLIAMWVGTRMLYSEPQTLVKSQSLVSQAKRKDKMAPGHTIGMETGL